VPLYYVLMSFECCPPWLVPFLPHAIHVSDFLSSELSASVMLA